MIGSKSAFGSGRAWMEMVSAIVKGLSTMTVWSAQTMEAAMSGRASTPVTSIRAPGALTRPSGVWTETGPVWKTPAAAGVMR